MSQEPKKDFAATDKAVTDLRSVKSQDTRSPILMPESSVASLPPSDDAMVQQILERQAVFGF
jgi:hypothetical protein